ncbi:hypothetical protein BGZ94_004059 [Podila epigama]|nr:hypothetical protein BGZ94_004059 [Podila epigama]
MTTPSSSTAAAASSTPVPHIRIVPHLDAPRSLHFDVVDKDVPEGFVLKIGRFTDKQTLPNRVTFKSKVVSRGHAEIYSDQGKFYIRDTKSSSGTFLNHTRLSPPGVESKPAQLKDGDVVQLGVDYQGGTQEIYRCVKMRLELNRSWQQQANPFRMNTLKAIRNLTTADTSNSTDCCICLFRIASFQSLFVAPCSHVYHYKCIRPMLVANHPGFLCPLCRTFADLEDTVEIDDPIEQPAAAAVESEGNAESMELVEEPNAVAAASNQSDTITASNPAEDRSIPTPPSEEAHTSQENSAIQVDPPLQDVEMPQALRVSTGPASVESLPSSNQSPRDSPPSSPSSSRDAASASPSSGSATLAAPLNITIPQSASGSRLSTNMSSPASSQQSPASAFFLAPSPPTFVTGFGVTPIPFSTPTSSERPSSQQQQHPQNHQHQQSQSHSHSQSQSQPTTPPTSSHNGHGNHNSSNSHHPTSPSSHVGHMFQNFVRNITIPSRSRSRSRTNSNSALSPAAVTPTSQGPSHGLLGHHPHSENGNHMDVFGKTLVVSSTPMLMSNSRNHGISDLGPVSEMESETVNRDDNSNSSGSSGRSSRGSGERGDEMMHGDVRMTISSGEQSPTPQVHLQTPSTETRPLFV